MRGFFMMKKSIVLSDINSSSNIKAVLTLERKNDDVEGMIRFYNLPYEFEGLLTLGFYVDKEVIKSGLTKKSNSLYTFFLEKDFLNKNFSCAVIVFKDAEAKPLLYGSSEGRQEDIYANIISELSQDSTIANVKNVLDRYGVDFDAEEKKEIENAIDECMETNKCSECLYKKAFYNAQKVEASAEKVGEEKEKSEVNIDEEKENFFFRLKPQIDKLFENNPIEKNLEEMIPASKWVKVEYEDDGDFYVFGLLYEGEKIKYVCYGVPAIYEDEPPQELTGYPIFLPLDKNNLKGFGYWLTYQDAETGEPVKAIIE